MAAKGDWVDRGRRECTTHSDCSPMMNCYTDFKCRDPCVYSKNDCGTGAECRVVDRDPQCYCPPNFTGDPKKECKPNRYVVLLLSLDDKS